MANCKIFYIILLFFLAENFIVKTDGGLILNKIKEIRDNIRNTLLPPKKNYSVVDAQKNNYNPDVGTYSKIDGMIS